MNKTAIKNFAVWARRKLISDITYKAGMLGISESGIAQPLSWSTQDLQFFDIGTKDYAEVSGVAVMQRNGLVNAIRMKEAGSDYKTAFRSVVEEVAYTWFNRLIAVRFMEVNDYLPSHIRVLSSENEGKLEPDFVTTPFDTDLEFSAYEKDLVYQLKDENKLDELFRMLFIKQCNKLSEILPGLFEQISDYTELLLNISFTDKDGIVYHLTHDISEDEFNVEKEGQVEIIGWMYQYYNTELKDDVFALLKKNVKITKERIPAATQLFTPDWIVRYMVENSLGRLWVEGHPNESLKSNWKYYLEEAEQEPDVVVQLNKIREEYAKINPVDIKVIDPCMGSGHILVYAFDVLMQIYTSQGYVERDAAKSILINNLYGIDIDVRAYQLAYFAVMMKARQYNRKIFSEGITPNLIAIRNPRDISVSVLKKLGGLEPIGLRLVEEFKDAEEYGSILQPNITVEELDQLDKRLEEIREEAEYGNLLERTEAVECLKLMKPLVKQGRLLCQKYDVVVTNPPYMGASNMNPRLSEFIKKNYVDYKCDFFSAFMVRCSSMTKEEGYCGFFTPYVWMFIQSYEKLRQFLYSKCTIESLIQFEYSAFEEATVPVCTLTFRNQYIAKEKGCYLRLTDFLGGMEVQRIKTLEAIQNHDCGFYYIKGIEAFSLIPGQPVAYWLSEKAIAAFVNGELLEQLADIRQGLATSDNEKYLRLWHEVKFSDIDFKSTDIKNAKERGYRWFPFSKGGSFRKWYGNQEYIVDYYNDGADMKANVLRKYPYLKTPDFVIKNTGYYFKASITWTEISSSYFGVRYCPPCSIFSNKSNSVFPASDYDMWYILALLCSKPANMYIKAINPTITTNVGDVAKVPIIYNRELFDDGVRIVKENIEYEKDDWNQYETSWDYKNHPFMTIAIRDHATTLSECWNLWQSICDDRFIKLKANEEELNRKFIEIYDLQHELSPEVADKEITISSADLGRDVRSLLSYFIGCLFGRYSLDFEGLVYAGGEWDASRYSSFIPDADNCIPITDEEYFQDDIVGRFVEFVRAVFGSEKLEENLDFVAAALGNKGNTSREVIRNYFLNDFYKDHLKVYQKRPIYWLFDSGKQNGFKALVYMHRWNADTVGNLRIEYLHKMQTVYEHEIDTCQEMIDHGSGHDVAVASRRKEKLVKQLKECKNYDALVAHIAFSKIDIDLDDGVKVNYRKVQTGADGKFCEILAASKDIMAKEK